jgi:hypothetical protein
MWYRDFSPVSDEQVEALLAEAGRAETTPGASTEESGLTQTAGRSEDALHGVR